MKPCTAVNDRVRRTGERCEAHCKSLLKAFINIFVSRLGVPYDIIKVVPTIPASITFQSNDNVSVSTWLSGRLEQFVLTVAMIHSCRIR